MTDMLLVQDAERVERADVEFLTQGPRDALRQLASKFLISPSGLQAWIVSGFAMSNATGKVLTVTRGVAILSTKEQGQVVVGTLTSEGPATIQPDLSGYATGTYGIYIRFDTADGGFANRVFWDPVAAAEFVQNVPTRRYAGWSVQVSLGSPGADWFKIGIVAVSASPPLVITPQRLFYFEGDESASYTTGWGYGNDRNANRALYGIGDLRKFGAAVLKKLEEIQSGTARWWTAPAEPLDQKVSRNGDLTLDGDYKFNGAGHNVLLEGTLEADGLATFSAKAVASGACDLGDATTGRWGSFYAKNAYLKDAAPEVQVLHTTGSFSTVRLEKDGDPTKFGRVSYLSSGPVMYLDTDTSLELRTAGVERLTLSSTGVVASRNVVPSSDSSKDLGESGTAWRNAYIDSVYATTTVVPVTTELSLGASDKRWNAYVHDVNVEAGGYVVGDLIPQGTSGVRTLGGTLDAAMRRWKAYLADVDLGGQVVPASDAAYDLGTVSYRLRTLVARAMRAGTATTCLQYTYSTDNMSAADEFFVYSALKVRGEVWGVNDANDTAKRKVKFKCAEDEAVIELKVEASGTGGCFIQFEGSYGTGYPLDPAPVGLYDQRIRINVNGNIRYLQCFLGGP